MACLMGWIVLEAYEKSRLRSVKPARWRLWSSQKPSESAEPSGRPEVRMPFNTYMDIGRPKTEDEADAFTGPGFNGAISYENHKLIIPPRWDGISRDHGRLSLEYSGAPEDMSIGKCGDGIREVVVGENGLDGFVNSIKVVYEHKTDRGHTVLYRNGECQEISTAGTKIEIPLIELQNPLFLILGISTPSNRWRFNKWLAGEEVTAPCIRVEYDRDFKII